jgi:Phage integrase, N-terminal SAM-like domain
MISAARRRAAYCYTRIFTENICLDSWRSLQMNWPQDLDLLARAADAPRAADVKNWREGRARRRAVAKGAGRLDTDVCPRGEDAVRTIDLRVRHSQHHPQARQGSWHRCTIPWQSRAAPFKRRAAYRSRRVASGALRPARSPRPGVDLGLCSDRHRFWRQRQRTRGVLSGGPCCGHSCSSSIAQASGGAKQRDCGWSTSISIVVYWRFKPAKAVHASCRSGRTWIWPVIGSSNICDARGDANDQSRGAGAVRPGAFFTKYLPQQRGASPHTIRAYRDALKLLLVYTAERCGCEIANLELEHLNADVVAGFLDHIETERSNSATNPQLSAGRHPRLLQASRPQRPGARAAIYPSISAPGEEGAPTILNLS